MGIRFFSRPWAGELDSLFLVRHEGSEGYRMKSLETVVKEALFSRGVDREQHVILAFSGGSTRRCCLTCS